MAQPAASLRAENEDPLLDGAEAAAYLGLSSRRTLDTWRSKKRFVELLEPTRVGRHVKYKKSVLDRFIASRTGTGSATNGAKESQADEQ